jgi:hypothetical protein
MTEQMIAVLEAVESVDDGVLFPDPVQQGVARLALERGLIIGRIAEYPDPDTITAATTATVRGGYRYYGLTPHGKKFLANGGPPDAKQEPELTAAQLARRDDRVAKMRERMSDVA